MSVQVRIAPSLGALEGHPNDVWGTVDYKTNDVATVFFGMYGLPDFFILWKHEGRKYILWAGSDILHLQKGYWLEDGGYINLEPKPIANWINKNCDNWCENVIEQQALADLGIMSNVAPSYMGETDLPVTYEPPKSHVKVYASASNDPIAYGWPTIERIARRTPNVDYHLYGINGYKSRNDNVISHGRVPKEKMNAETAKMQAGIRLNEFDGFSEILAKSVLRGQYCIGKVPHPEIPTYADDDELINWINGLKDNKHPNAKARNWYRENLNDYPWNNQKK